MSQHYRDHVIYSTDHVLFHRSCFIPQTMFYSTDHVLFHRPCFIPQTMFYSADSSV